MKLVKDFLVVFNRQFPTFSYGFQIHPQQQVEQHSVLIKAKPLESKGFAYFIFLGINLYFARPR
jgi:hypothetical protein